MHESVWDLGARHLGGILGGVLLWGTIGAVAMLLAGVGVCVVLARSGALRVTFAGARFARGVTYVWIVVALPLGGGTLGALHGTSRGLAGLIEDPSFVAGTLRSAGVARRPSDVACCARRRILHAARRLIADSVRQDDLMLTVDDDLC